MYKLIIRTAETYDLRAINRVIESAVHNWPASARYKRLAVSPLQYDDQDLLHYEILVAEFNAEIVAIAAWDADSTTNLPNGIGGLFHGLYVLPVVQRQGIGRALMDAVFAKAARKGLSGLLVKAHRFTRSYFEKHGLEVNASNDEEYPWQYWKRLSERQNEHF